jgi:hypothetical protein
MHEFNVNYKPLRSHQSDDINSHINAYEEQ